MKVCVEAFDCKYKILLLISGKRVLHNVFNKKIQKSIVYHSHTQSIAQSSNESYILRHLSAWGPSFKMLWTLSFSVEEFSIVSHKESLTWVDLECVCIGLSDLQFPLQCWPLSLHHFTHFLCHLPPALRKAWSFELIFQRTFANTDALSLNFLDLPCGHLMIIDTFFCSFCN